MKKLYFLFALFGLLFVSCDKTGELNYTEKRLVGSWFYTNVDFAPRWGFRKDITNDYFGHKLSFYEDFTMVFEDTQAGTAFNGVWQVNQVNAYSAQNSGNCWNEQLVASYEDTQAGTLVQLIWDQVSVTKNRINVNTSTEDGHYTMQLKKF